MEKNSQNILGKKQVEIFTDGACSYNPGPGGYGAILRYNDSEKEFSGGEKLTTNNRMEMMAVIVALEALKEPVNVSLYSDSKYVIDSLEKGWAESWQRNNWKRSNNKPALNPDLWERLLSLSKKHNISYHWVKGHDGHLENERADTLATAAAKEFF